MRFAIELQGDAYSLLHDEATSISDEAKGVVFEAQRIAETLTRRLICTKAVAEELHAWFRDHARGYLAMKGHEWKYRPCQDAVTAIDKALGLQDIRKFVKD